jgi:hypothetical protein
MAYQSYSLIMLGLAAPGHEGESSAALKVSETLGAAIGASAGGALVAFRAADGPQPMAVAATFGLMAAIGLVGCAVTMRLAPGGRIGEP